MSTKHTAVSDFPRRDARDKLQGRTRYTVDRAHVGMLHAALARAERPPDASVGSTRRRPRGCRACAPS